MHLLHAALVMAALSITGPWAEAFAVSSAATKVRVGVVLPVRPAGVSRARSRSSPAITVIA
jgi:hypothetical protein